MPNGQVHQLAGAATAFAVYAFDQERLNSPAINPLTVPVAGFALGKLPDWLEPALHLNHRQFFHSFVVLFGVLYGVKKAYEWQPQTELERFLRGAALIAGSVYATHLVLDGMTKKSLPILGRLYPPEPRFAINVVPSDLHGPRNGRRTHGPGRRQMVSIRHAAQRVDLHRDR